MTPMPLGYSAVFVSVSRKRWGSIEMVKLLDYRLLRQNSDAGYGGGSTC